MPTQDSVVQMANTWMCPTCGDTTRTYEARPGDCRTCGHDEDDLEMLSEGALPLD